MESRTPPTPVGYAQGYDGVNMSFFRSDRQLRYQDRRHSLGSRDLLLPVAKTNSYRQTRALGPPAILIDNQALYEQLEHGPIPEGADRVKPISEGLGIGLQRELSKQPFFVILDQVDRKVRPSECFYAQEASGTFQDPPTFEHMDYVVQECYVDEAVTNFVKKMHEWNPNKLEDKYYLVLSAVAVGRDLVVTTNMKRCIEYEGTKYRDIENRFQDCFALIRPAITQMQGIFGRYYLEGAVPKNGSHCAENGAYDTLDRRKRKRSYTDARDAQHRAIFRKGGTQSATYRIKIDTKSGESKAWSVEGCDPDRKPPAERSRPTKKQKPESEKGPKYGCRHLGAFLNALDHQKHREDRARCQHIHREKYDEEGWARIERHGLGNNPVEHLEPPCSLELGPRGQKADGR